MRTNIDRVRELDIAWNERRWVDVSDLVSPKVIAHYDGCGDVIGRDAYLHIEQTFCSLCPDLHLRCNPYITVFSSADGRRTASIARLTGTYRETTENGNGATQREHTFDVRTSLVRTWTNGVVTEQFQFIEADPALLALRLASAVRHEH